MMHWDPKSLLKFADIVPGHHLRTVRELPGFDSWGVDYKPGSWPDVLWIGDGSADFNPKCHPFMAAHEALHSISTRYTDLDDYQFFLYNICEDWRVNTCLLGIYGDREIQDSYKALKQVVLCRWQSKPLQLKSPISIALQHLCYMNHLHSPRAAVPESASEYFQEMLFLRQQFGLEDNWPLVKNDPDRGAVNTEKCKQLLDKIKAKKAPRSINVEEIRKLIRQMGYDIALFKERLEIGGAVEVRKLDAPARGPGQASPPPQGIPNAENAGTRRQVEGPTEGEERNMTHD
jgi:hypothetical protein